MATIRNIQKALKSKPTREGAGVHLKRVFGFSEAPTFDPFLLLDDFRSDDPSHYAQGFPWHPHQGIETITYVLAGEVEHGDSIGHKGVKGPVQDVVIDPEYLDVRVPANTTSRYPTDRGHTVFAYVIEGQGYFCNETDPFTYEMEGSNYFDIQRESAVGNGTLVLFDEGDEISVSTESELVRFLLISGKPIAEPVAGYGPIVMNTQEELRTAFEEYRAGTFIKSRG